MSRNGRSAITVWTSRSHWALQARTAGLGQWPSIFAAGSQVHRFFVLGIILYPPPSANCRADPPRSTTFQRRVLMAITDQPSTSATWDPTDYQVGIRRGSSQR